MLKQAADFVSKCRPAETVIIYHKSCGDGICAAAILARAIGKISGGLPTIESYTYSESFAKLAEKIQKFKKIIFIDLAIDKYESELIAIKKSSEILLIDHHELTNNLNDTGILHVHPKFFYSGNSSRYVGAKLAYDICAEVTDVKKICWLAGVGLVHDMGSEDFKEFMDFIYKEYPELKAGKNVYGFDSRLGQITSVITAASYSETAEKTAIKLCIVANDPMAILERKYSEANELMKFKEDISKEIDDYVKNWKSRANYYEDLKLAVYEIKSKHDINSPAATILSIRNPDVIFVLYKILSGIVNINMRSHAQRINCAELAKRITAKLENGTGGGHIPAAGGSFAVKDLKKFLELVPKLVKEML